MNGSRLEQAHDDALVLETVKVFREKLLYARASKGRSGWWNPELCDVAELENLLMSHAENHNNIFNYVDIAILSMMLYIRKTDGDDVK